MDELKPILMEINANLALIAVSLKKIADNSERVEVSGIMTEEINEHIKLPTAQEIQTGPKYREHSEIGKGPVMEKTCGQEVCRCLRNDGSCAAHHPEFCPKCKKLNRI